MRGCQFRLYITASKCSGRNNGVQAEGRPQGTANAAGIESVRSREEKRSCNALRNRNSNCRLEAEALIAAQQK